VAYANSVTYSGQGLTADGFGGYDLNKEICGVANGADTEGPYLLYVLTATGAKNADITGPWGTAPMTKTGNGTFKYVAGWSDPSTLPGNVTATYDGKVKNAQLTISHGCRPFTHGAWCSPGFWRNADDAAWTLAAVDRTTAMFNGNVSTAFYGNNLATDQLLQYVLDHASSYGGTLGAVAGTDSRTQPPNAALTAFNATGAYLTDHVPGYSFDPTFAANDNSDTCPIDSHGNFKMPQ